MFCLYSRHDNRQGRRSVLLKWRDLNPKIGKLSVVLALAVFALAAFVLSKSQFEVLSPWGIFQRADGGWLGASVLTLSVAFLFRAGRWRFLVSELSVSEALALNGAFYGANLVLPFRLGEGVRPVLLAKRGHGGVLRGVGLVVWERIFDLAFSTLILALGLFSPGTPRGVVSLGELSVDVAMIVDGFAVLVAVAFAALLLLPLLLKCLPALRKYQERSGNRFAGAAGRVLEELSSSLSFLRSLRALVGWSLATLLYWGLVVCAFALVTKACHFEPNVTQSCLLTGLIVFGMLLPAPPAQLGLHQAVSLMAILVCFPIDEVRNNGSLFAGAYYLVNLGVVVSGGIAGYLWLARNPPCETPSSPSALR